MKPLVLAIALTAIIGCTPTADPQRPANAAPEPTPTAPAEPTPTPEPPAPTPAETATVPERFQGEWNSVQADCGTANNPSRLRIGADDIRFHESSGTITSVAVSDETDITLVSDMTGEGQVFEATHEYRLSNDGDTLTDTSSGTGMVRQRCD